MTNVLKYAADIYVSRISLILLFSISFVIAFLIPSFATFPTYNDLGGIFVRTASVFANLTPFNTAIIVMALVFSLLFLSFAIVAINVIVKHSRTHTKIRAEVMRGLEMYTGRVFLLLLFCTAVIAFVNIATYSTGYSGIFTAVISLVLSPLILFGSASIVIDENKIFRAIKSSAIFFTKRIDYSLLAIAVTIALLTFFDFIFDAAGGTSATGVVVATYAMLIFSSLFILPFIIVLESEMYVKRFPLLKH